MNPRRFQSLEEASVLPARPLHLAIGMFDGVHLGHRAVIEAAVQSARSCRGIAAVLTFWPHPSRLLRPTEPVSLLMGPDEKVAALGALGIDAVIVQPFDADYASIEAEAFLQHLRKRLPQLACVYVGENWRFGRGRRGDIRLLIAEARRLGLNVVSAERINRNGEPISSTRIRACLQAGEIEEVNRMLGRAYTATGVVVPGKQLGRTIGFPTLNLDWQPELQPCFGVYAVRARRPGENEAVEGVANFGLRPTVEAGGVAPKIEVHLLADGGRFGPGDRLEVELLAFLRPEMKFARLEALTTQIARDRDEAVRWFRAQTPAR